MSKAPETHSTDMQDAARKEIARREGGEVVPMPAGMVETRPGKFSRDKVTDVAPATAISTDVVIGTDDDFKAGNVVAKQRAIRAKKQVALPVLRFEAGTEILVQFGEVTHLGKPIPDPENNGRMKRVDVATVRAQSGAVRVLVCGEVLKNELEAGYPNGEYVGRWFYLRKFEPDTGRRKRYATYEIIEIEDPRNLGNAADRHNPAEAKAS